MVSAAARLLAISSATRHDLEDYARERGWSLPPVEVTPLAAANLAAEPHAARPLQSPYFVVLGTIEPRKNHSLLLHLWRELALELGASAPHLVVIGKRGWECENVVDLLERCAPIHGLVHELADCSDAQLASYLAHAQALLFPSFVEGYGLPLAEAMGLGVPAIASDLPVFREVAGDVPEYLHPLDGAQWLRVVRDYCSPASDLRAAQLQRLRSFSATGWVDHFRQVDGVLDELRGEG
jgi:glycosyltransferase involved in cell wall biosynthesis